MPGNYGSVILSPAALYYEMVSQTEDSLSVRGYLSSALSDCV
jgi:hypothetical protein